MWYLGIPVVIIFCILIFVFFVMTGIWIEETLKEEAAKAKCSMTIAATAFVTLLLMTLIFCAGYDLAQVHAEKEKQNDVENLRNE